MQAERIVDGITYESEDGVGIWSVDDITTAMESGTLEAGEEHFREVASQPSMTAVVVEVGGADQLSKEVMDHVNEQWTALAEATGIDATAYVADGIGGLAVSNKNEADGVATDGFTDRESAVEWAKQF